MHPNEPEEMVLQGPEQQPTIAAGQTRTVRFTIMLHMRDALLDVGSPNEHYLRISRVRVGRHFWHCPAGVPIEYFSRRWPPPVRLGDLIPGIVVEVDVGNIASAPTRMDLVVYGKPWPWEDEEDDQRAPCRPDQSAGGIVAQFTRTITERSLLARIVLALRDGRWADVERGLERLRQECAGWAKWAE